MGQTRRPEIQMSPADGVHFSDGAKTAGAGARFQPPSGPRAVCPKSAGLAPHPLPRRLPHDLLGMQRMSGLLRMANNHGAGIVHLGWRLFPEPLAGIVGRDGKLPQRRVRSGSSRTAIAPRPAHGDGCAGPFGANLDKAELMDLNLPSVPPLLAASASASVGAASEKPL